MSPIKTDDPQVARLIERVEHIARAMDDLRPLVVAISSLQKDQERNSEDIKKLNTIAEMRGDAQHLLDKRVLVLERWHKGLIWFSSLAMGVLLSMSGYIANFVNTLDTDRNQTNNRLSTLEVIVNSQNFERSMATDNRPVAEGSK